MTGVGTEFYLLLLFELPGVYGHEIIGRTSVQGTTKELLVSHDWLRIVHGIHCQAVGSIRGTSDGLNCASLGSSVNATASNALKASSRR